MGIVYNEREVRLEGMIDAAEVPALRLHLAQMAPDPVVCRAEECRDMHTAVLQLLLAYKALFGLSFVTDGRRSAWGDLAEGFWLREDDRRQ